MKFRIKIEELNNGKSQYTPQVKFNWYNLDWENICDDGYTSKTMRYIYQSENEAMNRIQEYKKYLGIEKSKEVKKTKYITFN